MSRCYECDFTGNAKVKVKFEDGTIDDVLLYAKANGYWQEDMQYDAYCWHDEGNGEYEDEDIEFPYLDEYEYCEDDDNKNHDKKIVEVIEIINADLEREF